MHHDRSRSCPSASPTSARSRPIGAPPTSRRSSPACWRSPWRGSATATRPRTSCRRRSSPPGRRGERRRTGRPGPAAQRAVSLLAGVPARREGRARPAGRRRRPAAAVAHRVIGRRRRRGHRRAGRAPPHHRRAAAPSDDRPGRGHRRDATGAARPTGPTVPLPAVPADLAADRPIAAALVRAGAPMAAPATPATTPRRGDAPPAARRAGRTAA